MADEQKQVTETAETTQTSQPASQESAAPSIPQGKVLVDEEFVSKANRWKEQVAGSQKFWETAKQYGIDNEDGFRKVGETVKRLRDNGLDLDTLAGSFSQSGKPNVDDDGPRFDPDQFTSELDKRLESKLAEREYQSENRRESELASEYAKRLIPEGASDPVRKFVERSWRAALAEARENSFYDEGHPLATKAFKPLDKAAIEKIYAEVSEDAKAVVGAQAKSIAKSKPSTAAGSTSTAGDDKPNENLSDREKAQRKGRSKIDQIISERLGAGQPTSTLG